MLYDCHFLLGSHATDIRFLACHQLLMLWCIFQCISHSSISSKRSSWLLSVLLPNDANFGCWLWTQIWIDSHWHQRLLLVHADVGYCYWHQLWLPRVHADFDYCCWHWVWLLPSNANLNCCPLTSISIASIITNSNIACFWSTQTLTASRAHQSCLVLININFCWCRQRSSRQHKAPALAIVAALQKGGEAWNAVKSILPQVSHLSPLWMPAYPNSPFLLRWPSFGCPLTLLHDSCIHL